MKKELLFIVLLLPMSLSLLIAQKNYALFFSVNEYQNFTDLSEPIQNAEDIASELSNRYNFAVEVVKNPTRAKVRQKLIDYRDDFQIGRKDKEGQLFLFFSGHGEDREEFGSGCWIPTDGDGQDLGATTILYSEWRNFINRIDCKHILVAIDACYSGTFDPRIAMRSGIKDGFKRPNELGEAERIKQDHQKRKARLYLASGAKEKTPDKSEFAKKLLTGLRLGPSRFDVLSINEIFADQIARAQPKPVFGTFGDDDAASSFLFVEKLQTTNSGQVRSSQADLDAWKKAQVNNTVKAYQAYLDAHPEGRFASQAKLQLDDDSWNRARQSNTIGSYEVYLQAFPKGKHFSNARRRIQEIADDTEWEITTTLRTPEAYEEYLRKFPQGLHAKAARKAIRDSDGDGVFDSEDKCPNEKGLASNNGCPSLKRKGKKDRDGDGIPDKDDKCPNESGSLNNNGCPTIGTSANVAELKAAFVRENMIPIAGGNFTLGCNIGNTNCDKDEFPKKNVSISDLYIQKDEVTNSQFLAFLQAYKSDIVKEGKYAGQKIIYPSTSGLTKKNGVWSIKKGYENHPVVNVTWFGAVIFANYYGLRLPTEAEWEFVAKGGKNNHNYAFSGGNNLYNIGVYEGNSNFDSAVVGSKGNTHVLNVNDMSGNVWEWCQDWYSPSYTTTATTNPKGPNSGTAKLIRGGSYSEGEWEARVTNRAYKKPITHSNNIGFRCAK